MNFELDRYHNLHFWIFKRLNDELTRVDARIESTCWYIPQGITFQFFKLARPLQSIFYHVVGIRPWFSSSSSPIQISNFETKYLKKSIIPFDVSLWKCNDNSLIQIENWNSGFDWSWQYSSKNAWISVLVIWSEK